MLEPGIEYFIDAGAVEQPLLQLELNDARHEMMSSIVKYQLMLSTPKEQARARRAVGGYCDILQELIELDLHECDDENASDRLQSVTDDVEARLAPVHTGIVMARSKESWMRSLGEHARVRPATRRIGPIAVAAVTGAVGYAVSREIVQTFENGWGVLGGIAAVGIGFGAFGRGVIVPTVRNVAHNTADVKVKQLIVPIDPKVHEKLEKRKADYEENCGETFTSEQEVEILRDLETDRVVRHLHHMLQSNVRDWLRPKPGKPAVTAQEAATLVRSVTEAHLLGSYNLKEKPKSGNKKPKA